MNHCGGFPADWFVTKPSDHFNCGICLEVLNNPHQCKNGHSYCLSCISSALEVNRECPTCKTALKPDTLSSVLVLKNVIGEMIVKCTEDETTSDSCEWTGPLDQCFEHFETCEHRVVVCPLSAVHACCIGGCSGNLKIKDKINHLTSTSKVALAETVITLAKTVELQQKEIKMYHRIFFNKKSKHAVLNGGEFFGSFGEDGAKDGFGIFRNAKNGGILVGNFVDENKTSFGVLYSSDTVYRGDIKDNRMHGEGLLEQPNNNQIEFSLKDREAKVLGKRNLFLLGSFKNDEFTGYGKFDLHEGKKYTGEHICTELNGQGVVTFSDSERVYKGKFENYEPLEPGEMTYPDGSVFVGAVTSRDYAWENGKFTNKDGVIFEGDFSPFSGTENESTFSGYGTITYTNGDVYKGGFQLGQRHRQGTLIIASTGESLSGEWKRDKLCTSDDEDSSEDENSDDE